MTKGKIPQLRFTGGGKRKKKLARGRGDCGKKRSTGLVFQKTVKGDWSGGDKAKVHQSAGPGMGREKTGISGGKYSQKIKGR